MLYHLYDIKHAALTPLRLNAKFMRSYYSHPWNPLSHTQVGRTLAAGAEMVERATRHFGKPSFGLEYTKIDGKKVAVHEEKVMIKPFCHLIRFKRDTKRNDPKVLIVAPMSGHFATLLRGTVNALLPHHDVYITDWIDARQVPLEDGTFNLDSYIAYLLEFFNHIGDNTHVVAVCQPAVPVFAAVSLASSLKDYKEPATMTLMGGPIDTRISKTKVNELAENRDLSWFEENVTMDVPFYYPGAMRKVYPGFIQLTGFMSMNLDTHVGKHIQFYHQLLKGDGDSAEAHRKFYNEYLSVMDIPAEFYLQTVDIVFQRHLLPKGQMKWRDPKTKKLHDVDPSQIKKTALLTIEGEHDDISALGQTTAAHDLVTNLPKNMQYNHLQQNVGHYGIFNGRRWRQFISPRLANFIRQFDKKATPIPTKDKKAYKDLHAEQWDKSIHSPENALKHLEELRSKEKSSQTKKTKNAKTRKKA